MCLGLARWQQTSHLCACRTQGAGVEQQWCLDPAGYAVWTRGSLSRPADVQRCIGFHPLQETLRVYNKSWHTCWLAVESN